MRLSPQLVEKYFVPAGKDRWRIVDDLRQSVQFSPANIIEPSETRQHGMFDVIFCRNVLIYFDDASRRVAAENLFENLAPGGFICLGHTESMSRISPLFEVRRFADAIVYQRPLAGGRGRAMAEPASKRILVVDDASLVRRYYRDALERAGFEVDEALNGVEALEKLLGEPADLLIVDVNMPQMDGFTFLQAAAPAGAADRRACRPWSSAPKRGRTTGGAARAAGANFYLVKPVAQEALVQHVAIMCGLPA